MHNGVVSLEAIEDDIITLENQIDNLNAVLREAQLRGKNPGPVRQRIRDEKVRLSLLKAAFKRESDKDASSVEFPKEKKVYETPKVTVLKKEPDEVSGDEVPIEAESDEMEEKDAYAWVDAEEDDKLDDKPAHDEPFDDDLGNVPGVVEMENKMPYQPGTYTSCDLSSYCDMVNTEFVTAQYNTEKKLICVHFSDPRDYEVFLYLLKERADRMRFFKKRKPIFIRVRAELGHRVDSYEMGFYGCRVVNVLDNTAIGPFGEEKHFCEAVFKYRNLEIKQTTLLAGPISNNGTTDTKNKAEDKGTKQEDNNE